MKKIILTALVAMTVLSGINAQAARIKDIASFQLESDVQLIGYGLVVGLDGTGDSKSAKFTAQSLANMMERMGVTISADEVKVKNIASVMVTAKLSPFARAGSKVDCTVSSLGDASSLQGGMLLVTPLSGLDGTIYATAQGPVSIGGFNVQSGGGDKITENYALVGQIPNGGIIEKQAGEDLVLDKFTASLITPDFTTSHRLAERINIAMGNGTAQPLDEGNIQINVPESYRIHGGIVDFISKIETLEIVPDVVAKVIINEKTGTIVAGEHVTISAIALAHGSLKIEIKATPQVSQPESFSGGQTVLTKDSQITASAEPARIISMKEQTSIGDLAGALNDIGATPRDIIAIFQALKAAGALRAELVIM